MPNLQRVRATFQRHGYNSNTKMHKIQFQQFLNLLLSGQVFDTEVAAEIWEQAGAGSHEVLVEQICTTIIQAQNIVQNKLISLEQNIRKLQEQLNKLEGTPSRRRSANLQAELQQKQDEKISFQQDMRLLTEPFGISTAGFMATAARNQREGQSFAAGGNSAEPELRWLFYLCVIFAVVEIIVIYRKYDFLNLIVVACVCFIFLMNQFDSLYIKFSLGLLIASQLLDMVWLFMNANDFWNPPAVGTSSYAQRGYLKFIIILTLLGIFLKIPLGVFLYHYRNADGSKQYNVDLGLVKMQLSPSKGNPMIEKIKGMDILS